MPPRIVRGKMVGSPLATFQQTTPLPMTAATLPTTKNSWNDSSGTNLCVISTDSMPADAARADCTGSDVRPRLVPFCSCEEGIQCCDVLPNTSSCVNNGRFVKVVSTTFPDIDGRDVFGASEREAFALNQTNQALDAGVCDTFVRLLRHQTSPSETIFELQRAACGSLLDFVPLPDGTSHDGLHDMLTAGGMQALLPHCVATSIALRLLVGVYILHDRLGLSHNDLHLGNVLLTPCSHDVTEYTITLKRDETIAIAVVTQGVQVMIADFGSSCSAVGAKEGTPLSLGEMCDVVSGSVGAGLRPTPYSRFSADTDICSLFYLLYGRASPQFLALKAREHCWSEAPSAELVMLRHLLILWSKEFSAAPTARDMVAHTTIKRFADVESVAAS